MFTATNQTLDNNYPGGGSVTGAGVNLVWNTASNGATPNGVYLSIAVAVIKQRLEFIDPKPGAQQNQYRNVINVLQQAVDELTKIEVNLP